MQKEDNTMSEGTSNLGYERASTRRSRRFFSKGRRKIGRGRRPRKLTQLMLESVNDENTTNSENSEGNPLYNEIDWEQNLECDTTLVDEFAPRALTSEPSEVKEIKIKQEVIDDEYEPTIALPDPLDDVEDPSQSYQSGDEIYVKSMATEGPNEWLSATVVETDWEENEILIRYHDGNPPPPMEWVTMNSKRLTKKGHPSVQKINLERGVQIQIKKEVEDEVNDIITPPEIAAAPIESIEKPARSKDYFQEQTIQEIVNHHKTESIFINSDRIPQLPEAIIEKQIKTEENVRIHKTAIPRRRGGWKRHKQNLVQTKSFSGKSKFAEDEKVLAKWSDHRMQKFPAVVKRILGDGRYDVLFYDGYVKQISEEHIFKTTEEEVAKYQQANPSEADSFVDMDADSKEARRQRKRKTFDDYVFARDFKAKRKVFKTAESFRISRKLNFLQKSTETKDSPDPDKQPVLRRRKMRRRRRGLFGPKKENPRSKLHMLDLVRDTPTPVVEDPQDSENFYGFESGGSQGAEEASVKKFPGPVLIKEEPKEYRWANDHSLQYKPINITGIDGVMRKSVAVPDSNLPTGWTKHAVLKPDNIWQIFLLSPDGYQISTAEELTRYYATIPNGGPPPASLDFEADFSVLPDLETQQKDLSVVGTPKIWIGKKRSRRGGRRGGRGGPGRSSIGRVRTLLPKFRVNQTPPAVSLPPTPISLPSTSGVSEGEMWRCPKEACDKKFRKESLLQMHIKHYHSELSSLVRSVPNMVDLATARSESVNSDWKPSTPDVPKVSQPTAKRILPRPFTSPSHNIEESELDSTLPETPLAPVPGPSRIADRGHLDSTPLKRQNAIEERRTTIKTMLPIRPAEVHVKIEPPDEPESEEEYIEQKKNGSRIFKPGKYKRGGRFMQGSIGESSMDDSSYDQLPLHKVGRKRKYTEKIHGSPELYDLPVEEEKPSLDTPTEDGVVVERLKSEEFINCICGFREEDGLMIQCDICMCWQHGHCSGIESDDDVPDRYVCAICRNPFRVRSSHKYSYAKQYLTQGKLASFSYRTKDEDAIAHREMMLKRCYELSESIYEMKNVDRSLEAKLNIARKADHPKLYMWAKNWEDQESKHNIKLQKEQQMMELGESSNISNLQPTGPQPEAPIDLEECRSRLLEHVEQTYCQMEDRITSLETQIMALESLDPDLSNPPSDKVTKQTLQMLIRDLSTLQKLAAIS